MPSDPTPTTPTIYRVTSASTLASASNSTVGQQQLSAEYNPKISQPPSLYNTVSSSSRQITPKRSNHSSTPLLLRNRSEDAGTGEDDDAEPCARPHVTIRGQSSYPGDYRSNEERGDQSGGRISRGPSRRSTGVSETSPTLIDPPPQFDLDELRKAYSRSHRTGSSSTNPRNTLGGNASRRGVRASPDTGKGSALSVGSMDRMRYYSGGQNRNPSGTFFRSSGRVLAV